MCEVARPAPLISESDEGAKIWCVRVIDVLNLQDLGAVLCAYHGTHKSPPVARGRPQLP